MQPPQVIPVTFKSSVCMVMFLSIGLNKNYTVIRLEMDRPPTGANAPVESANVKQD
jgi:hypothetical protein